MQRLQVMCFWSFNFPVENSSQEQDCSLLETQTRSYPWKGILVAKDVASHTTHKIEVVHLLESTKGFV